MSQREHKIHWEHLQGCGLAAGLFAQPWGKGDLSLLMTVCGLTTAHTPIMRMLHSQVCVLVSSPQICRRQVNLGSLTRLNTLLSTMQVLIKLLPQLTEMASCVLPPRLTATLSALPPTKPCLLNISLNCYLGDTRCTFSLLIQFWIDNPEYMYPRIIY